MSLKASNIQIGQSGSGSNNFHWRNLLDGLIRLSRGNLGDVSPVDVIRVNADNSVEFPSGIKGGFSKEYVSEEQVITAGGLLTLTHGLGVKPKLVTATLVCKTAEAGYSVNDEVCVPVGPIQTDTNNTRNLSVIKTATSLEVKIAASLFVVLSRTTGTVSGITAANWRLVVRAWA